MTKFPRRIRDALWVAAFASWAITAGRRWITGALFVLAFIVGLVVEFRNPGDEEDLAAGE